MVDRILGFVDYLGPRASRVRECIDLVSLVLHFCLCYIVEPWIQNRSAELSHFMFYSCRQTTSRIPGPTLPCGVVSFTKKNRKSECWRTCGWTPLRSVTPWKRCVPSIQGSIPTSDDSRHSERIETPSNVPLVLQHHRLLLREPNSLCNTLFFKFHSVTILPGTCHSRVLKTACTANHSTPHGPAFGQYLLHKIFSIRQLVYFEVFFRTAL
jgi:hypothetical protein